MVTTADRLTYAAAQAARVAFYGAHYLVARLLAHDAFAEIDFDRHSFPSLAATLKGMRSLFEKDIANAEAGLYPLPLDIAQEVRRARASLRYLADIPRVAARRRRNGHSEIKEARVDMPRYYRQNFHYQTDGYLSADSAKLYDFQVETLFAGTADAMRRRAFVPIAGFLGGRNQKRTVLLDVGAGTGGFLSFVKTAAPDLKLIALDLSKPYLERAEKRLSKWNDVQVVVAPAEKMPLPDKSADAAVSIYLFHELPPAIRSKAAREIARVLKPGGLFVLAETIQYGDLPDCDGLIATFPDLLYEPYYDSFARQDLRALFAPAGLMLVETDIAYLTKNFGIPEDDEDASTKAFGTEPQSNCFTQSSGVWQVKGVLQNCHSRASGNPAPAIGRDGAPAFVYLLFVLRSWIPACAGMTRLYCTRITTSRSPRLRVQIFLCALAGLLCPPICAHAGTAYSNWAAVVVAGDDRAHNGSPSPIFDNARRGVVHELEATGFSARNIAEFSVARHSAAAYPQASVIANTLRALAQQTRGGCMLYFSSHGAPGAMVLGKRWLTPAQLARIVDSDCGSRPTVVVVSACFSGAFVPALAGENRLILTAARRDRSSFGCGQTDRYPYFDECVLSAWPHVEGFVALGRAARACVAAREKREHVGPASEPQLRIGTEIAASLPKWR